jgi:hypothetical protein
MSVVSITELFTTVLPEIATIAGGDKVIVHDVSTGITGWMTRTNFVSGLGGGGSQTPWTQDIAGDQFNLSGVRRLTVNPTTPLYNQAANVLSTVLHIPAESTLTVAANKILSLIRESKDDGGYNVFTIGSAAQVDGFNILLQASSSSHATSILHAGSGVASNAGPGAAKGLYGRGIAETGCTGVAVGGVFAVTALSGMTGYITQLAGTTNTDAAAYIQSDTGFAVIFNDGIVYDQLVAIAANGAFLKAFQTVGQTGYFL